MKAFILDPKNRYAYCPNRSGPDSSGKNRRQFCQPRADRHARSQPHSISDSTTRQSPRKIGKCEQKLPYAVTSAMVGDISRENARPGLRRRRNSLIHQAGKNRPNVRRFRTCLAISEKPGLRETRARRFG